MQINSQASVPLLDFAVSICVPRKTSKQLVVGSRYCSWPEFFISTFIEIQ